MLNATPDSLEAVLSKHSDLFRDELGTIRGITAKLHVSPAAKPRFYRPVPFLMPSGREWTRHWRGWCQRGYWKLSSFWSGSLL